MMLQFLTNGVLYGSMSNPRRIRWGAAPTALPRQAGAGGIMTDANPALPGWADV